MTWVRQLFEPSPRGFLPYTACRLVVIVGLHEMEGRVGLGFRAIYCSLLFAAEGVLVVQKNPKLERHPDIPVPNLHVMMAMKTLKSKDFCDEIFNWQHNYYTLKNEGMEYLRDYLRLPVTVFPATLTKKTTTRAQRPDTEVEGGGDPENWRGVSLRWMKSNLFYLQFVPLCSILRVLLPFGFSTRKAACYNWCMHAFMIPLLNHRIFNLPFRFLEKNTVAQWWRMLRVQGFKCGFFCLQGMGRPRRPMGDRAGEARVGGERSERPRYA